MKYDISMKPKSGTDIFSVFTCREKNGCLIYTIGLSNRFRRLSFWLIAAKILIPPHQARQHVAKINVMKTFVYIPSEKIDD